MFLYKISEQAPLFYYYNGTLDITKWHARWSQIVYSKSFPLKLEFSSVIPLLIFYLTVVNVFICLAHALVCLLYVICLAYVLFIPHFLFLQSLFLTEYFWEHHHKKSLSFVRSYALFSIFLFASRLIHNNTRCIWHQVELAVHIP